VRLRRALIHAADRSIGRRVLASLATGYARRQSGADVEVLYDRAWVHRIDSIYMPVSDRFEYRRDWDTAVDAIFASVEDSWFFHHRPGAGDTIVDVGAGDGLDCLAFSRAVGDAGTVLAIEAHPTTFGLLEETCRLNGIANVVPVKCAVMDRGGSMTMAEGGGHRDQYSIASAGSGSERTVEVPATTLDELCAEQGIGEIDLLKMNIEGAEPFALDGARETLARTAHVSVACHDFMSDRDSKLATKGLVAEMLRQSGFEVATRNDHPLPWVRDHVHAVQADRSAPRGLDFAAAQG
jgi:FkbM family methyltransferase